MSCIMSCEQITPENDANFAFTETFRQQELQLHNKC